MLALENALAFLKISFSLSRCSIITCDLHDFIGRLIGSLNSTMKSQWFLFVNNSGPSPLISKKSGFKKWWQSPLESIFSRNQKRALCSENISHCSPQTHWYTKQQGKEDNIKVTALVKSEEGTWILARQSQDSRWWRCCLSFRPFMWSQGQTKGEGPVRETSSGPPGAAVGPLPQGRQESMATTRRGPLHPLPSGEASPRNGQGTVHRAEPGHPPDTAEQPGGQRLCPRTPFPTPLP